MSGQTGSTADQHASNPASCRRVDRRGIAVLTLDDPRTRNALGPTTMTQLRDHLDACMTDAAVRSIVVTGAGTVFSSGWNISGDSADDQTTEHAMVEALDLIASGPTPTVARVNGHAIGGAVGLVAACDLSIASDLATFGFTEVRLGLAPTTAAVHCVPKMSAADARELLMTGERFDSARAVDVGLINRSVPDDQLDATVDALCALLAQGAPAALAACKRLARAADGSRLTYELAAEIGEALRDAPEAVEGFAAYRERRAPKWVRPDDIGDPTPRS